MKMTANLSNVVVLLDGIKNNHEIELSVVGSKRTNDLMRIAPLHVFPLRENSRFFLGRYFFDDTALEMVWVAIIAYGDFASGVNSETISKVEVGVVTIHKHHIHAEIVKRKIREYFQSLNPKQECVVLALFNQDELFKKAKSVEESSFMEIVCDRIMKWVIQSDSYRISRNSS
jgi:hypothetical protein